MALVLNIDSKTRSETAETTSKAARVGKPFFRGGPPGDTTDLVGASKGSASSFFAPPPQSKRELVSHTQSISWQGQSPAPTVHKAADLQALPAVTVDS